MVHTCIPLTVKLRAPFASRSATYEQLVRVLEGFVATQLLVDVSIRATRPGGLGFIEHDDCTRAHQLRLLQQPLAEDVVAPRLHLVRPHYLSVTPFNSTCGAYSPTMRVRPTRRGPGIQETQGIIRSPASCQADTGCRIRWLTSGEYSKFKGSFIYDLSERYFIDTKSFSSLVTNHSCSPNARFKEWASGYLRICILQLKTGSVRPRSLLTKDGCRVTVTIHRVTAQASCVVDYMRKMFIRRENSTTHQIIPLAPRPHYLAPL